MSGALGSFSIFLPRPGSSADLTARANRLAQEAEALERIAVELRRQAEELKKLAEKKVEENLPDLFLSSRHFERTVERLSWFKNETRLDWPENKERFTLPEKIFPSEIPNDFRRERRDDRY